MLLRVGGELQGAEYDPRAVTDDAADSGVAHGRELLAFATACVTRGEAERMTTRDALEAVVGPEAMVEAAGVIANFERMVRIADGTGIPLDKPIAVFSVDLRRELGIDAFGAAACTPKVGSVLGALGRRAQPLARALMSRYVGRVRE